MRSNREVILFNEAYSLGFHAWQLEQRRRTLEKMHRIEAETAGHYIAVVRGYAGLSETDAQEKGRHE